VFWAELDYLCKQFNRLWSVGHGIHRRQGILGVPQIWDASWRQIRNKELTPAGARSNSAKPRLVLRPRLSPHQLHRLLQGCNGFGITLYSGQCNPQLHLGSRDKRTIVEHVLEHGMASAYLPSSIAIIPSCNVFEMRF